jgi:hypothetical protein
MAYMLSLRNLGIFTNGSVVEYSCGRIFGREYVMYKRIFLSGSHTDCLIHSGWVSNCDHIMWRMRAHKQMNAVRFLGSVSRLFGVSHDSATKIKTMDLLSRYKLGVSAVNVSDSITDALFDHVQKRRPFLYACTALALGATNIIEPGPRPPVSDRFEVSVCPDRVPKIRLETVGYTEVGIRNFGGIPVAITSALLTGTEVPDLDDAQFVRLILDVPIVIISCSQPRCAQAPS